LARARQNIFQLNPRRLIELSLIISFVEDSMFLNGIKGISFIDDCLFLIYIIYNLKQTRFKLIDLGILLIFIGVFLSSAIINNSSILQSTIFIRQFLPLIYYLFIFKIGSPTNKESILKMLKFFIILQTGFNFLHLLRIAVGFSPLIIDSFTGSFSNANVAGIVSVLALTALFVLERKHSKVLLSLGLINILISYSRTGYVCLIILSLFLYFNKEKYGINFSQKIKISIISGSLLVYYFVATMFFDPFTDLRSGIQTHFFSTNKTYSTFIKEDGRTTKDLTRVAMYMQAYNILQKGNIFVGNGPSSFSTGGAYRFGGNIYKSVLESKGTISVGSWLGIMVELGLISLFIIFFMLNKKLLYLSKKSKNKFYRIVENKIPLLQFICLIVIIISSLFLNNFEERALTYWLFYFSYA